MNLEPFQPKYDIVLIDPPWPYYGDGQKHGAAAKHYDLMTAKQINDLPVRSLFRTKDGVAFVWATAPKLDLAIDAIRAWGLHYRGVAFVWTKTRRDGAIIGAQGVRATVTKPTSEFVLTATTKPRGRPFPLLDETVRQDVLAPKGRHSEKPYEVHKRIERLYGDRPRIEVFARTGREGWDCWGLEAPPLTLDATANVATFDSGGYHQ